MLRFQYGLLIVCLLAIPAESAETVRESKPSKATEVDFDVEVMSILSKAGCNSGTCHGNLNGKGGFKLSLRGQDSEFDFESLVRASRGRRVSLGAPRESLFLKKATGVLPHRGGIRFDQESTEFKQLLQWLQHGAPGPSSSTPQLKGLIVEPASVVVRAPSDSVQVRVEAEFANGSRDVTERACYELSNLNANVTSTGQVERAKLGETTLIVRYLDKQVAVPIAFIDPPQDFRWQTVEPNNFIDRHVLAKLKRLSTQPSTICDDATFVRRVYLDVIGKLPTAEEARRFVAEDSSDKRADLIDALLFRPEFADFWALKFSDTLRVEEKVLDPEGVKIFHAWIRKQIQDRVPHDEFVQALVTGTGSTFKEPSANFYRANRDPVTRGETTARLFLGTRLQCAKCHNHPFDRWTQDDYYQWSTVFSQLDYEIGENKRRDKLDKNEFAGEQVVLVAKQEEVRNPTTDDFVQPKFLGGTQLHEHAIEERLGLLADWLTSADNELFVQSQVNFVWYHVMGQGLVDPIDDFRLTNPASNPPLLEALAEHFVAQDFDLRELVRAIVLSRTYQASSVPLESNQHDTSSYSKALVRRFSAEVLLDMQSDVLGVPAKFAGLEEGVRAVQIPGAKGKRSKVDSGDRFLRAFGKPERILACDCERSNETSLQQVLGLIGEGLHKRIAKSERLLRLASSDRSDREVIEELYWTTLTRAPTAVELAAAQDLLRHSVADRSLALQDLAWALMNAKEFLFRK